MVKDKDQVLFNKLQLLSQRKFTLQDNQAKEFRDIKLLQSNRMKRGKLLINIENEIRDCFGKIPLRKEEII